MTPSDERQALTQALHAAARAPVLLIACDFDGTLSEIAPTPHSAMADAHALGVLAALDLLPHTHAAIISGRALSDLTSKLAGTGVPLPSLRLVGCHGLEFESGTVAQLPIGASELLETMRAEVGKVAQRTPGALIEVKPTAIAFHYREVDPALAEAAVAEVVRIAEQLTGVFVLSALAAVELCVLRPDKGQAVELVRRRVGASAVVFFGDDTTDERVFEVLGEKDVGIRVGSGTTVARLRVDAQAQVAEFLEVLLDERRRWHDTRGLIPIERHAVLSDQRTVAIIEPRGAVSWLCLPRLDSAPLMAELVGGAGRGTFVIAPADAPHEPRRAYLKDSMILRSDWGGLTVTDYLDCSGGRAYQRAGRTDLVRTVEGRGRILVKFAPRLDFGRVATRLERRDGGLEVQGGPDPMTLLAPGVEWRIEQDGAHQTATAEASIDGPLVFELRYGTASLRPSMLDEPRRREDTRHFWAGWASALTLPTLHTELVRRSAIVIKSLCYAPSGSIAAAGTTSLPEHLGGSRNWDYRYCWLRDAAMGAASLVRLGNTGVAMKLLDWLTGVVERCESAERLRPLYTVLGGELGAEAEIGDLAGYGQSKPVRIGNAASSQVQLDVFGPIVDLVATLAERGVPVTPEHWKLVQAMVQAVALRWAEPDHGIWEIRRSRRHHVHSKVMCWHAVDRAIVVAHLAMGRAIPEWERLKSTIAADVLSKGWHAGVGAFTCAYGEPDLDAASLAIGLTGLLAPDDPRFIATVNAVERGLLRNGVLYRYLYDDGLAGLEGGWILCTAWLIEAMTMAGRAAHATELLDLLARCAGDLGLLPEQIDPETGLGLGNYPQVYSHLGFINAAVRLAGIERGQRC